MSGQVRSHGKPIPGAVVEASAGEQKISTTSDEQGRWSMDLPGGNWKFKVEIFGFQPKQAEAAIPAPSVMDFDLELLPKPPSRPQPGMARGRQGFQDLAISDVGGEGAPDPAAVSTPSENASEAFLLSGSLTGALSSAPAQQGEEGPGGLRPNRPSMAGAAGPGEGGMGGGGPRGGGGGFGGGGFGGGGFGGGGRGGGGFGGGPGGGFGRGGPNGGRRGPPAAFGNRQRARGANAIRGMAFYSIRDSGLDARPFSLTGQTVAKPDYSQNRFGVTLGGPLVIPKILSGDRTFFFISYNGSRASNPFNAVATLPSALERSGDFSQSGSSAMTLYDPSNQQPFPGNRIPANRVNSAALGLLPYIPLPNQLGAVQNYQYVTSVAQNSDSLSVRLNQGITQKDRLGFNLQMQNRNGNSAQIFGFTDDTSGRGWNMELSWSHTFSRRLVNNLRLQFNRSRSETVPFFSFGTNVAAELGIRGTAQDPINYGPPNLSFTNFGGLSDASPNLLRNQTVAISEGLTFVKGRHNFSFGGDFRRIQMNSRTDQNARGTFTFTGLATSALDATRNPLPNTGFDFADFLLGLPQSGSVRFGSSSNYFRGISYSAFAQDDLRVRSNLTFNLGLRYEYASPFQEKYGQLANLDVAPGFTGVAVVTPDTSGLYSGKFPGALVNPDRNNIAPRLAMAWKPWPKKRLQVKSAYGIYYNNSVYTAFATRLASQPPFARTSTVNTSPANVLTLQDGFTTTAAQTIKNTFAVDRFYRLGYAQNWTVSIQQDLPRSFVVEAAYLGTKGTRLDIQRLPNRAAPGSPVDAETRRLIGDAVGFTFDSSEGNSIYHAGQARLTRRFRRGMSMNALYTYAKSIDNVSTFGGGGGVVAQDDKDLHNERGLSTFDRRHNLNLTYFLTSPVAQAGFLPATGWTGRLLKDWTLSGGATIQSGTPITARVLGNRSDANGSGVIGSGRADSTGFPVDTGDGFFNLQAFGLPPSGRFGNAGRNTIPGPWSVVFNASLGRSFRFTDRRRLEFRVDSNNVLNHVNISGVNAVVNALNYGLATSAGSMRSLSAQLRFRF